MHTIRLHGPWNLQVENHENLKRLKVPFAGIQSSDWTGENFLGVVEFRRKFNWPNPIDPGTDSIQLYIESDCEWSAVSLNGQPLEFITGQASLLIPIQSLLKPHNELRLQMKVVAGVTPSMSITEVSLRIVD